MKPESRRTKTPHPVRPEREALPPASHFATCPRGLEALLETELAAAGAQVVRQVPAGVLFMADAAAEMRANLTSRIATRILRKVGYTRYRKEEHIYRAALDLPWPEWFDVNKTIAVKVGAQNAPLKSLNFITLKIKDAICDRFREETRERPSVDTEAPDVPVYAFFTPDAVTFYLDTSGEPLFKRGFKREASAASIKENLAAGLLMLSGWEPGTPLLDPMCGAGTILLEAADMALNRAPGRSRHFAFEHYRDFDAALWKRIKIEAQAQEKPLTHLPIFGADQDRWVLDKARNNLEAAGYADAIELKVSDVARSEGTRAGRHHRHQPALRRAAGRGRGSGRVVPAAGRLAEAELQRLGSVDHLGRSACCPSCSASRRAVAFRCSTARSKPVSCSTR